MKTTKILREENKRAFTLREMQHSMKRRAPWHDYRHPGAYMLTVVVEGRRQILGRLEIGDASGNSAWVVPSPLGEAISSRVVRKLSEVFPQVEVWRFCIMPDHIHMIVRVKEALPAGMHLGDVVAGFKRGCHRAARELGEGLQPSEVLQGKRRAPGEGSVLGEERLPGEVIAGNRTLLGEVIAGNRTPAGNRMPAENRRPAENGRLAGEGSRIAGWERPVPCDYFAGHKSLFEAGYNDKLLFDGEQLLCWKQYLADNPRRLAMKRLHPDLFMIRRGMRIAGHDCQIVGNQFLLDIPDKVAVIVHSRYSDAEYARYTEAWLACGERGGVLVSAAISQKEKAVLTKARERGYRIIWLTENGFPKYYKPTGKAFDGCSAGLLLQVSPWEYQMEERDITRQECLELNAMAIAIAGGEIQL